MKKNNILLSILGSILILSLLSCGFASQTTNETLTLYPEKLTDITVEGSTKAIIAINTSTIYLTTRESTGISPLRSSQSYPKPKQKNESPIYFLEAHIKADFTSPPNNTSSNLLTSPSYLTTDPNTTTFYYPEPGHEKENVEAILIASNNECVAYIESNTWENLKDDTSFSTNLNNAINYFGNTVITNAKTILGDTIGNPTDQDDNEKVVLFITTMGNPNIAGFFNPNDLYGGAINSNGKEMLYINKQKIIDNDYKHVIAHEYVHLLTNSYRLKTSNHNFSYKLWIEEGIAEGLTPSLSNNDHIISYHFESLVNTEIKNGMGLVNPATTYWQIYSLAHTFLEYCRIQLNQADEFYKTLIENTTHSNYISIETLIQNNNTENSSEKLKSFEEALIAYKIANHTKHPSNKYGYKNHNNKIYENKLKPMESPTSTSPELEATGSIYYVQGNEYSEESIDTFIPANTSNNIKFFRISP